MNTELKISHIKNWGELRSACKRKKIYLYGAGVRASSISELLECEKIVFSGYIVSQMKGNPRKKNGFPVVQADKLPDNYPFVIFSIDIKDDEKKCYEMVSSAIKKIYLLDNEFYDKEIKKLFETKFKKVFTNQQYEVTDSVAVEKNYFVCKYKQMYFRVPPYVLNDDNLNIIKKTLEITNPYSLFEQCYGDFNYLPDNKNVVGTNGKTYSVYMARCHVDKFIDISDVPSWIIPIQTGAALTDEQICKVRDNQGDNISDRNRDYSECTAIYWMWKNAPYTDYVGLCHYRRHFDIPEDNISIIGNADYDIVVTIPTLVTNNHDCFRQFVSEEDIETLFNAVKRLFPSYYDSAKKYYRNVFCPPCNMFIMKYNIFREYAEFAFGVTEEIDRYYKEKNIIRKDRFLGFLMENLLDIFLVKNSSRYKIGYTNMRFLT